MPPEPWDVWGGRGPVLSIRRFAAQSGQPSVALVLAGEPPVNVTLADGAERFVILPFSMDSVKNGALAIAIGDARATSPAAFGAGQDRRILGIGLSAIEFRS